MAEKNKQPIGINGISAEDIDPEIERLQKVYEKHQAEAKNTKKQMNERAKRNREKREKELKNTYFEIGKNVDLMYFYFTGEHFPADKVDNLIPYLDDQQERFHSFIAAINNRTLPQSGRVSDEQMQSLYMPIKEKALKGEWVNQTSEGKSEPAGGGGAASEINATKVSQEPAGNSNN